MWEIGDGELAVIFLGSGIVGLRCRNFVIERAEVDAFSVNSDSGPPFVLCFAPIDALVSGT